MNKYLVISYDPDQQQWFYDVVFADSEDMAKEKLCGIREYAIDADALDMATLARIQRRVEACTAADSESWLDELRAEAL